MAVYKNNPPIVTNGLVLNLDAGNVKSYPRSGTIWSDMSGFNNSGSLVNGPTYNSDFGGSIVFDGTDDYVTLGTPSLLNTVQVPLTITAWANLNTNSGLRTLYGAYKSVNPGELYSLIRVDNGILRYFASSTSSPNYQFAGSFTPTIGTWAFYAVTVSGSISTPTVTIYLNASSQTFSYTAFVSNPSSIVDFRIGGNQAAANEVWGGNISNVQVYNRALSATEVFQNYNALKSRFGL